MKRRAAIANAPSIAVAGEDGADRAAVNGPIGMTSGLAIDGAGVEAGGAADAVQRRTRFGVGKNFRATVIEQDYVELLRSIALRDAGPDGVIGIHAFAGG